jgi:hypothetical protein
MTISPHQWRHKLSTVIILKWDVFIYSMRNELYLLYYLTLFQNWQKKLFDNLSTLITHILSIVNMVMMLNKYE